MRERDRMADVRTSFGYVVTNASTTVGTSMTFPTTTSQSPICIQSARFSDSYFFLNLPGFGTQEKHTIFEDRSGKVARMKL